MTSVGITFPDSGFHIAVLGCLLDSGVISEDQIVAVLGDIGGDDWVARVDEAATRLHAIPLDPDAVGRIQRLDADGGNQIYLLLERGADVYTGGEDDLYYPRSIEGIGALTALRRLDLDCFADVTLDLGPLAGHPTLASITLADASGVAVLETIPTLVEVDARLGTVDDPTVLDRLAADCVKVVR